MYACKFTQFSFFLVSMTTLEHTKHTICRKGYAPHYLPQNLALFQHQMHDFTLELVNVPSFIRNFYSHLLTAYIVVIDSRWNRGKRPSGLSHPLPSSHG